MLYALVDGRTDEPSKEDGSFYHFLRGGNYIFQGIGDEFAVVSSPTSLTVTLGTGEGMICGRHVKEKALNYTTSSLTLPPNSSGYVVIRFENEGASFTYTPTLANDNINVGGKCDLALYGYVTGASGVVTFVDMRAITNGNSYYLTMEDGVLYANTMNGKKKLATREI